MQHISDNQPACFLTLRQASRKSSRSPDTVARWCASLDIGFRDERGRWHVHAGKLAAVITARQVLGLDEPAEADAARSDMSRGAKRPSRFIDRIAFRCSAPMVVAIQQAAGREGISSSDYARRATARQLRVDGFAITDNPTEAL